VSHGGVGIGDVQDGLSEAGLFDRDLERRCSFWRTVDADDDEGLSWSLRHWVSPPWCAPSGAMARPLRKIRPESLLGKVFRSGREPMFAAWARVAVRVVVANCV
jgi:hypothetical protein